MLFCGLLSGNATAWTVEKRALSINTEFNFGGDVRHKSAKYYKRGGSGFNTEDSRQIVRVGTYKSHKPTARVSYFRGGRNSFEYWTMKDSYDNVRRVARRYKIHYDEFSPGGTLNRDGIDFEYAYMKV
jgi:hypothetical protein